MEITRNILLERSGSHCYVRIEPPLSEEEIAEMPHPSFYGGKGCEPIEPRVHLLDDATIVDVRSWVFVNHRAPEGEDERFAEYGQLVAETLGGTSCSQTVQTV